MAVTVVVEPHLLAPCAGHAEIKIEWLVGGLRLAVQDDGLGSDPGRASRTGRMGIPGMRERAGAVGRSLRVESRPGAGTLVQFYAPYLLLEPGACGSATRHPACAQMAS